MTVTITHKQVLTAVKDTLSTDLLIAGVLERAQTADEITDDIPETPLMQVYWVGSDPDDIATTAKSTFGKTSLSPGAVHVGRMDINVYVYVQQRNHIGQDLDAVLEVADAVYNLLEQQEHAPYFGVDRLQQLNWSVEYATLAYGNPERKYAGMNFSLTLWIY